MSKPSQSPQLLTRNDSLVDPSPTHSERRAGREMSIACEDGKATAQARAISTRRRGDDPTTCDPDYSPAELEFIMAIQQYKQASGRKFPTWREVLEVLVSLGYERAR